MSKRKVGLLFSTFLLTSCFYHGEENKIETETRDYSDYEDLFLSWNNLFSPAKPLYFAYIYSSHCYYCNNIKTEIFDFIDSQIFDMYLISFSSEISVGQNIEQTINSCKVEDVFIKGTPTLLQIENGKLTLNIAGSNEITDYLDNYKLLYES